MKFLLGEKLQMTQFFSEDGRACAATVVVATPLVVTQVKTKEKDGYDAIQVGFGERRTKNIAKAQVQAWSAPFAAVAQGKEGMSFRYTREFRLPDGESATYKVGDIVSPSVFGEGDVVEVSGTSKGKGFQGVVKRHGFGGGRRTHGQKHSEREPGSIGGAGRAGGRVAKGMRMAGRMGSDRVTVKNLKVLAVDPTENLVVISGAIPGRRGTLLEIRA